MMCIDLLSLGSLTKEVQKKKKKNQKKKKRERILNKFQK